MLCTNYKFFTSSKLPYLFCSSLSTLARQLRPWLVPSHPVKAIQQMNGHQKKFPYGRSGFS
jgi:hypothetical protein